MFIDILTMVYKKNGVNVFIDILLLSIKYGLW